ncbi:MAG: gamma-glutamylcyclotransferase [Planctomycetes bacterium]|nr:gamma-glutamylcyclotransferase [Planctomycetota bacterium]
MTPECFFVYGTLKTGGRYHGEYCFDACRIEEATIPGKLYDMAVGYPALVDSAGATVRGQLIWFPDMLTALPRMDELEDYSPASPGSGEYLRVVRTAKILSSGQEVEAWVYIYPEAKIPWLENHGRFMADGEWSAEKCNHEGREINHSLRKDFFAQTCQSDSE